MQALPGATNTRRKSEFRRAGWGSEAEAGVATNIGICEGDQLDQAAEFTIPGSWAIFLRFSTNQGDYLPQ